LTILLQVEELEEAPLFRYLAEAGQKPVLINYGRGASWRNIAGGRPAFSIPELSDIAARNLEIFKELQKIKNIDFAPINYVNFAHNEEMYKALEASMAWSMQKWSVQGFQKKDITFPEQGNEKLYWGPQNKKLLAGITGQSDRPDPQHRYQQWRKSAGRLPIN
jgi:hypothetical protein